MNDLKTILSYEFKMKIREINSMIKNLFTGFIIVGIISVFLIFQFGKILILNQELIYTYKNEIFISISILFIIFTITYKRILLEWHPASMIHLSGSKFSNIFKFGLVKKIISHIVLSIFASLVLNNFKISFETIQMFLSFWNLFTISIISRYFIYNKGPNIKIVNLLLIYTSMLNFQLYLNKYLSITIILVLSYVSILSIKRALNTDFNFDKSFKYMIFINRVNSVATGNKIEDAQEFVRETSAEKSRSSIIFKK
ncbi:MAG: hypothetical protein ACTHW2_08015 [Tissierella sp.]|uniref:hypothetical protein n=1 Tax=Tissierella sp. TaxID=41274 RepID=UPI003F9AA20E